MNTKLHRIQNWPELAREAKWSARALAKKCNVTLRTLERFFLKNMGERPGKWLAAERQKEAMRLLPHATSTKEVAS